MNKEIDRTLRETIRGGGVAALPKGRGLRSSIYLLPNLITATSFFCGFLSIKLTVDGLLAGSVDAAMAKYVFAAYAILVASVADALDGSVARLTRTQSSFGVQFDSLSDVVSFGVAPAVLVYNFGLRDLGRLGFGIAFVYAVCGALRLARFNVQSNVGRANGNFTGIPIPMAAAPLAIFVLGHEELRGWLASSTNPEWQNRVATFLLDPKIGAWLLFGIVLLLAFGMISNFEYLSHKSIRLPRKHPFRFLAGVLVTLVLLLSIEITLTLAIMLILYCIHGPILWLIGKGRRFNDEDIFDVDVDDDNDDATETQ